LNWLQPLSNYRHFRKLPDDRCGAANEEGLSSP